MKTSWRGIMAEYAPFFGSPDPASIVTLQEGGTPLIPLDRIAREIPVPVSLHAKFEGANPTGSFKDRGMTLAVSRAAARGARALICASTGNTSASAAAYGVRAGLRVFVVIPDGKISRGKLAQAIVHHATVIQVEGLFDQALSIVREVASSHPIALVNSVNPDRLEGQRSVAFEIVDQMGSAPDYHFLPVGNAGNITASWAGYKAYRDAGRLTALPRMMGVQAEGAAPIVLGHVVEKPETLASAIRIGNPASWQGALAASRDSGGTIFSVSDEEILEAYHLLASREGVFCEPASAASLAGFLKKARSGAFSGGERIVLTLTGHGLKDPDAVFRTQTSEIRVPARKEEVLAVLGLT
uniref:Threonine synthase n=1 Tax=Leptospirillum ferrodiazotrophum TaxID=412449 RepID=C6HZV6_9BACT|nr:MAG: threonine synthase [Leptospirillum ferrodiazotrophum]